MAARSPTIGKPIPELIDQSHLLPNGLLITDEQLTVIKMLCAQGVKNKKIKRYYERDGRTPREKMVKLEKARRMIELRKEITKLKEERKIDGIKKLEEEMRKLENEMERIEGPEGLIKVKKEIEEGGDLSLEEKLTLDLKLNYSVVIDKDRVPHAFYIGKEKILGEGSFGKVKHQQNLLTKEIDVVKIPKKKPVPGTAESAISKEAGLLLTTAERDDEKEIEYQFLKYAGRHDLLYHTDFNFETNYPGKTRKPEEIISFEDRLSAGIDLFKKMKVMHEEQRILHRDLKAQNIMYNQATKEVTIIDYGLSKKMPADGIFKHNIIEGSPHMMAPEVRTPDRSGNYEYSVATDVYAGGATLMELFGFGYYSQKDGSYAMFPGLSGILHDERDDGLKIFNARNRAFSKISNLIKKITAEATPREINTDGAVIDELSNIKKTLDAELAAIRSEIKREKEIKEKEKRDKEAREKEIKDKEKRDEEIRDKEKKDKEIRDKKTREKKEEVNTWKKVTAVGSALTVASGISIAITATVVTSVTALLAATAFGLPMFIGVCGLIAAIGGAYRWREAKKEVTRIQNEPLMPVPEITQGKKTKGSQDPTLTLPSSRLSQAKPTILPSGGPGGGAKASAPSALPAVKPSEIVKP